jgi:hypothetical protein
VWNRIPDEVRRKVVKLALKETELSPRELAVTFTDKESYFVSEASTYRILKAHDLITSPAFIVIKAASEFKDKTTAINQLWQTDFTYLKVIGWGWFYLSTILDDYSRYIISWKLCTFQCKCIPHLCTEPSKRPKSCGAIAKRHCLRVAQSVNIQCGFGNVDPNGIIRHLRHILCLS